MSERGRGLSLNTAQHQSSAWGAGSHVERMSVELDMSSLEVLISDDVAPKSWPSKSPTLLHALRTRSAASMIC